MRFSAFWFSSDESAVSMIFYLCRYVQVPVDSVKSLPYVGTTCRGVAFPSKEHYNR